MRKQSTRRKDGVAHYFTDNGDADEEDADDWGGSDEAKVFKRQNQARACMKRLWKEGNVHFKSKLPKQRSTLRNCPLVVRPFSR